MDVRDEASFVRRIGQLAELNVVSSGASSHGTNPTRMVGRAPAPDGFVKLSVDGSSMARATKEEHVLGGIIRKSGSFWVMGFVGFIGQGTNLLAKLKAIHRG